jgi:hypothetical protein
MEFPEDPIAPEILTPLPAPEAERFHWLRWSFIGDQGLRAGWSALVYGVLFVLMSSAVGYSFYKLHLFGKKDDFSASSMFFGELIIVVAMAGAAAVMAFVEQRRSLLDYYLNGPQSLLHFFSGLAAGFAALSALVGAMAWGGWLHFGPVALSGEAIFRLGAIWGGVFLLVGCFEEGTFRCFLQFTLTRGINFWWALGCVGLICMNLALTAKGNGVWGVYAAALLGLAPCLWLQLKKAQGAGFWQAAWVTSTLFGSIHTGNGGENWIGIFAAALIGFVFCVSIRVTGTAWWAIGCHASWDWAETYFYGTADSGMAASGHLLTTTPRGNVLWSGGANGPEGSVLVLGIILLLLAVLMMIHGRGKSAGLAVPVSE